MAFMNYETPGITKIEFEDSLFVTTELDMDTNKEVKEYIESRGGIIKSSVTKGTNYLIYKEGEEETTKYQKALKLVQEKGLEINILPLSLFNILSKGKDVLSFGAYPFDADGTKWPIKWLVLKRKGKKALLLSAYGLDAKRYSEKWEDVTWETCTLRKWLNEEFYQAAFSDEEKKQIELTNNKNADNPNYHTPGGSDTEDKIFLLSIDEVKESLAEKFDRKTAPTPYAVKQGAINGYNGNCCWWLRSPGNRARNAVDVGIDGGIDDLGSFINYDRSAVCPALWVDLESEIE